MTPAIVLDPNHVTDAKIYTNFDPGQALRPAMPSDSEPPPKWWPHNTDQHQPLDFSTKTKKFYAYPQQPSPPNFHHRAQPATNSDGTPLTMNFFRPGQHTPPPAPLNVQHFGFLDPMIGVNDSYRSVGLLGGLQQQSYSFLDNRRPQTKNIRPFKAYPRDPLALPLGCCGISSPVVPIQRLLMQNDAYADFRKNMLLQSAGGHGEREKGSMGQCGDGEERRRNEMESEMVDVDLSPSSPMSPSEGAAKKKPRNLPDGLKDSAYWERRRKNNEAAKRSRDARRAKEDEIAIRAAYLEQENLRLKVELNTMKNETNRLRCMLYNS